MKGAVSKLYACVLRGNSDWAYLLCFNWLLCVSAAGVWPPATKKISYSLRSVTWNLELLSCRPSKRRKVTQNVSPLASWELLSPKAGGWISITQLPLIISTHCDQRLPLGVHMTLKCGSSPPEDFLPCVMSALQRSKLFHSSLFLNQSWFPATNLQSTTAYLIRKAFLCQLLIGYGILHLHKVRLALYFCACVCIPVRVSS